MEAKLIKTDGTIKDVMPKNGKKFTLKEMQTLIGGYVEMVHLKDDKIALLDEEGLLKNLPMNVNASIFLMNNFNQIYFFVGDVVYCDSNMF